MSGQAVAAMVGQTVFAQGGLEIGEHITFEFLGLTFHADTIWSTLVSGAITVGLGFWVRAKVTSGVPSKVQMMWEGIVREVTTQVEGNLGRVNPFVVPLAIALFVFILLSNWLEIIPSEHLLPAPTADVNLVYPLALLVIFGVHIFGIRERGVKGYFKHYFQPSPWLFPLNVIEEIVKPFTLALRLFGNIFAGGIMIALISFLLPLYAMWGANIVWKLFDMFIGAIQAFIFALLTVLYFGMMSSHDEDTAHTSTEAEKPEQEAPQEQKAEQSETQPAGAR